MYSRINNAVKLDQFLLNLDQELNGDIFKFSSDVDCAAAYDCAMHDCIRDTFEEMQKAGYELNIIRRKLHQYFPQHMLEIEKLISQQAVANSDIESTYWNFKLKLHLWAIEYNRFLSGLDPKLGGLEEIIFKFNDGDTYTYIPVSEDEFQLDRDGDIITSYCLSDKQLSS